MDRCDGYPVVELDSDTDELPSSSEDEIDVILRGTPQQKRALRRRSLGQKSSSEDEFEKELDAELNQRMNCIVAAQHGKEMPVGHSSEPNESGANQGELRRKQTKKKITTTEELSDSYSDDDDDDDEQENKGIGAPLSHDELLYDPDLDDVDQQWVDRQRRSYHVQTGEDCGAGHGRRRRRKQPSSDAVLCCPACMVVLCRDCQRHSLYKNQFRAMFVTNCSVDRNEILRYPIQQKQTKKAKKAKVFHSVPESSERDDGGESNPGASSPQDSEKYHPVHCTSCSTHVAMFDTDEVYHFFNVLEGNG